MFYPYYFQYYWNDDANNGVVNHEEFWAEAFRAHGRARRRISRTRQWRDAKRMLSRHGWADLSYFRKKQNTVFRSIFQTIRENVISMREDEDLQFINCMWLMENNTRDELTYVSTFPHLSLKIFVLLPSPAKAERYLFDYSCWQGGVYYLAIHFPTMFPVQRTWANASPDASRLLEQHLRHEIVNNVDEIRRITFASPETISDEEVGEALISMKRERWNRLIKIYLLLFRESSAWGDYLDYLREKGTWID